MYMKGSMNYNLNNTVLLLVTVIVCTKVQHRVIQLFTIR